MSDIERQIICEDQFFSLCYTLGYNGKYQTSLLHRCTTDDEYTWNWRWTIYNECDLCGIDIPWDLIDKWRLLLMTDEIIMDLDFCYKVAGSSFDRDEEREVIYWRFPEKTISFS